MVPLVPLVSLVVLSADTTHLGLLLYLNAYIFCPTLKPAPSLFPLHFDYLLFCHFPVWHCHFVHKKVKMKYVTHGYNQWIPSITFIQCRQIQDFICYFFLTLNNTAVTEGVTCSVIMSQD